MRCGFFVGLDVLGGAKPVGCPSSASTRPATRRGVRVEEDVLDLYPALSTMQDAAAFEIALNASIPADGSEGNIWLDNFKFVHFVD